MFKDHREFRALFAGQMFSLMQKNFNKFNKNIVL
jgi:hypothetical protein